MAYDFSYIILICKLYKMEVNEKNKSKKSKKSDNSEIIWSNPEEEIIDQVSMPCCFLQSFDVLLSGRKCYII